MTSALLGVVDDVGKGTVHIGPGTCRRRPVDGRREKRVRERDHAVRANRDQARFLGRRERSDVDGAAVGMCKCCGSQEHVACGSRKRRDPVLYERTKIVGNRQTPCGRLHVTAGEQARDLEREERVAARCVCEAHERRARKRDAEPLADDPLECGDRERPEFEAAHAGTDEVRAARIRTARRDQTDGPVVETPQRELEHRGRRRVEPLRVVDRNQHLALRRELAKH